MTVTLPIGLIGYSNSHFSLEDFGPYDRCDALFPLREQCARKGTLCFKGKDKNRVVFSVLLIFVVLFLVFSTCFLRGVLFLCSYITFVPFCLYISQLHAIICDIYSFPASRIEEDNTEWILPDREFLKLKKSTREAFVSVFLYL